MQVDLQRIIKLLTLGMVVYVFFYLIFLIKIETIQFTWVSTKVAICHPQSYGLKIVDTEIISFTLPQKTPCL